MEENLRRLAVNYPLVILHIVAALITTAVFLTAYAAVQQVHRNLATDPQLQIARDISNTLSKGKSIRHLLPPDTVNLEESLAVFAELFDKNGKAIQSTGFLHGNIPQPPAGIFEFTNSHNKDVITWQPQAGVRMAMVFEKVPAPGAGFVAVGRSLSETEIRESNLVRIIGIAWLACMALLTVSLVLQQYFIKRNVK